MKTYIWNRKTEQNYFEHCAQFATALNKLIVHHSISRIKCGASAYSVLQCVPITKKLLFKNCSDPCLGEWIIDFYNDKTMPVFRVIIATSDFDYGVGTENLADACLFEVALT